MSLFLLSPSSYLLEQSQKMRAAAPAIGRLFGLRRVQDSPGESAELLRELRMIAERQRHAGIERCRHRTVVARKRLMDGLSERRFDLLRRDDVLLRRPVQQHAHPLSLGAELTHPFCQTL